jgi:hypothetical protein
VHVVFSVHVFRCRHKLVRLLHCIPQVLHSNAFLSWFNLCFFVEMWASKLLLYLQKNPHLLQLKFWLISALITAYSNYRIFLYISFILIFLFQPVSKCFNRRLMGSNVYSSLNI